MNIQWFPGHMKKTKELIHQNLKLVDIIIELVDARAPISSRNPFITEINKPSLLVMNKASLADNNINGLFLKHFSNSILVDSVSGKGVNKIFPKCKEILSEKIGRSAQKGIVNKKIRAMVVGIPNVGKSTFINKLSGRKSAKAADKPGVTKGKQWISLGPDFEFLDTPGILWHKFEDENVGKRLAFIGSVNDNILDTVELAGLLLDFLLKEYESFLKQRYKTESRDPNRLLEEIAKKRGFILSGGETDLKRTADMILDEFRSSKIGRISLEKPY